MMYFKFAQALAVIVCVVNAVPNKKPYIPARTIDWLAEYMPKSDLPPPDGLRLKYVVLGIGTQNYTCASGGVRAAPGSTGATADLYDIGSRLNSEIRAKWLIPYISSFALSMASRPSQLREGLRTLGFDQLIGHHFFSGTSPVFALDQLGQVPYPMALVSKLAEVEAPTPAYPGANNEGALKWLMLGDTNNQSRGDIDTVYRLETAGGNKPLTCNGQSSAFVVSYSAQYWIYGTQGANLDLSVQPHWED